MSLTITRPFTISTYDPPSTPIPLQARHARETGIQTAQRLGGVPQARSRRSVGQDGHDVLDDLRATVKTPPVNKKILPWVEQMQPFEDLAGMFGPYDSRPPSQYQQDKKASTSPVPRHPFAYSAQNTIPLSALGSVVNMETEMEAQLRATRPHSEVLSRGAGMRYGVPGLGETPRGSRDSVGFGTFGIEASQDPVSSSEALPIVPPKSPAKSTKPGRVKPPSEIPEPRSASRAGTVRPAGTLDNDQTSLHNHPNVKIHHEFPFDPLAAFGEEAAAQAHLASLQRLIGAAGGAHVNPDAGGLRGPRETYQTSTSGPSFGHLLHQDGMPISRHISYQQDPYLPGMPQMRSGLDGQQFVHIPWGGNIDMGIPPHIMFQDDLMPLNVATHGVGHARLDPVTEGPGSVQRRDDHRSYVETVQDDEEPTIKGTHKAPSRIDTIIEPVQSSHAPAKTTSAAHPLRAGTKALSAGGDAQRINQTPPPDFSPAKAKSHAPRSTKQPSPPTGTRPPSTMFSARPPAASTHHTANIHGADQAHHVVQPYRAAETVRGIPAPTAPRSARQGIAQPGYLPGGIPAAQPTLGTPFGHQPNEQDIQAIISGALAPYLVPNVRQQYLGYNAPSGMTSQMPTQGSATPQPHPTQQEQDAMNGRIPSMASRATAHGSPRTQATLIEDPEPSPASLLSMSTSPSNVKQLVEHSKFHDEILCQLLDAARLNLIGSEAKKALQRAARARVIELRDMRNRGELAESDILITPKKNKEIKDRRSRSKDRKSRRHSDHTDRPPLPTEEVRERKSRSKPATPERKQPQPTQSVPAVPEGLSAPPEWVKAIMDRLDSFGDRLPNDDTPTRPGHAKETTQELGTEYLEHLISQAQPPQAGYDGMPFQMPFTAAPHLFGGETPSQPYTPKGGGYLRNLSTDQDVKSRSRGTNHTRMTWGSEVELPPEGARVSPPSAARMTGPIINIQAPTETNLEKSQRGYTASQAGTARTAYRGEPVRTEVETYREELVEILEAAMPEPSERDLPPAPSESIRSHRDSPVTDPTPLGQSAKSPTVHRGDTPISLKEALGPVNPGVLPNPPLPSVPAPLPPIQPSSFVSQQPPITVMRMMATSEVPGSQHTAYKTAFQSLPHTPPQQTQKGHNDQPTVDSGEAKATPWDMVTARLYSWAMVWEEESFARALEEISLGKQVEEFALSIMVMTTLKRMLRRNLSEQPMRVCDKLFVPPSMAEIINQACHAQQYQNAKQILEELWYPFLFEEPPRVIIALTRHLNHPDIWLAHRFDLRSGHLRTYQIASEESEHDGRPFRWWHAIRLAWPQYKIKDPSDLGQQTTTTWTTQENKHNNSLHAFSFARNLFLGFRPEHESDLEKMRENVWSEVKRLRQKKRAGKLLVEADSPSHGTTYQSRV